MIESRTLSDRWVDQALDSRSAYLFAGRVLPWLGWGAVLLLAAGFYASLVMGRPGVSILAMLHPPAVWMGTLLLMVMAFWAVIGLLLNRATPFLLAQAVMPTGTMFTALAIWSGALWMRALTGTWWVGGFRQWAEIMMMLVYLLTLGLPVFFPERKRVERALLLAGIVGCGVVMVLYFALAGLQGGQVMHALAWRSDPGLAVPMILVASGFWCYATYVGLVRLRCLIKEREFGLTEQFFVR